MTIYADNLSEIIKGLEENYWIQREAMAYIPDREHYNEDLEPLEVPKDQKPNAFDLLGAITYFSRTPGARVSVIDMVAITILDHYPELALQTQMDGFTRQETIIIWFNDKRTTTEKEVLSILTETLQKETPLV